MTAVVTHVPVTLISTSLIPDGIRKKVERLLAGTFRCKYSIEFDKVDIERQLFGPSWEPDLPTTSWYHPTVQSESIAKSGATPESLTQEEERLMLLRFNYSKLKLSELQMLIREKGLTYKRATLFLESYRRMELLQEFLVRKNLALVLVMIKRLNITQIDLAEAVSEGNLALLDSVNKFNIDSGNKFSTYACRAVINRLLVALRKLTYRNKLMTTHPLGLDSEGADWTRQYHDVELADYIEVFKHIVSRNLAGLTDTEHVVVCLRFIWRHVEEDQLTLKQVGYLIGKCQTWVRKIEDKALAKIRLAIEG
ncbi:sigma-70 family RNA polymerase sigma factor [Candidatus Parcubacteria bacterium]|nr:sigma-70 family RNA polymerase sigma factor [Candidatus Parcubacteria bacterium]